MSGRASSVAAPRGVSSAAAQRRRTNALKQCRTRSLWPLWYAASALGLQIVLVYQGCQRYLTYRSLPWRTVPSDALNAYASLMAVSCCCTVAAVATLFVRTGGYSSAGLKVGRDRLKRELTSRPDVGASELALRGLVPPGPVLHAAAGFCLMFATVFAEARAVHEKQLVADDAAGFEIFEPKRLEYNVSLGGDNIAAASASIPGLLLELVNLAYAIAVYSVGYASTFWFASWQFSVIFSAQLLGAGLLHCLSFCGWRLLFIFVSSEADDEFVLTPAWLTCLYVVGNAVLFLSSSAVFHYGYGRCREKIFASLRKYYKSGPDSPKGGFSQYITHTAALFAIAIMVACLGPIMYDHVTTYKRNGSRLLLAHLLCSVVYMLLWIMLWFSFTVKQSWDFKIQEAVVKRHAILLNRYRIFGRDEEHRGNEQDDTPSSSSSVAAHDVGGAPDQNCGSRQSADSVSTASVSTNNDGSDSGIRKAPNGILSQKIKQKRRSAEQKVKFQDATKVVIETNLDSDLDTIPESTHEDSLSCGHRHERGSPSATSSGPSVPFASLDAPDAFASIRPSGSSPSSALDPASDGLAILRLSGIAGDTGHYLPPQRDELSKRAPQRDARSESRSGRDSAIFSINSSQENSDCDAPGRQVANLRLNSAV